MPNVSFKRLRNISQVRELANAVVWAAHAGKIKSTDGKNIMGMLMQLGQLMLTEQMAKKKGLLEDFGDAGTKVTMTDIQNFANATVKRKTRMGDKDNHEETEVSVSGSPEDTAERIHALLNQVQKEIQG